MGILKITIPLIPTVQERARHSTFKGVSRTYKSPKQAKNEKDIFLFLNKFAPKKPEDVITTGVRMTLKIFLPIPKSWSKIKKSECNSEDKPHLVKGDLSNYIKNIEDCITKVGIWEDDCLVYSLHAEKYYSDKPRWEVTLEY